MHLHKHTIIHPTVPALTSHALRLSPSSSSPFSHRCERHEVADIRNVQAFRRGLHGWSLPGRQEAQVHHQIQEQQLDGQVQRGFPVVSMKSEPPSVFFFFLNAYS